MSSVALPYINIALILFFLLRLSKSYFSQFKYSLHLCLHEDKNTFGLTIPLRGLDVITVGIFFLIPY